MSYNPKPTRVWSRVQNPCSYDSSYNYNQGVYVPLTGKTVSQFEANYQAKVLQKGNILQYKKNSSNLTKKQKYAQICKGSWTNRTKSYATQTQTYTNPNTSNFLRVNYDVVPSPGTSYIPGPYNFNIPTPNGCISDTIKDGGSLVCNKFANPCTDEVIQTTTVLNCYPTTCSDVPGPEQLLCWDPKLDTWYPKQQYTMPTSGTKWPEGYKGLVSAVTPCEPVKTGNIGPQGNMGPQGDFGFQGNTGNYNLNGPQGATGSQGATGPTFLTVGYGPTSSINDAVASYSNINTIIFDSESDFTVLNDASNTAFIKLNSTFKYWEADGNTAEGSYLTANGVDRVNFVGGTGINISMDPSVYPQSITIGLNDNIGGGVINSGTTGTNDIWTLTNLINTPPFVEFNEPYSTSDSIYISWKYPEQINIGMLNLYVPVINTFSAQFIADTNNGLITKNILTDVSSNVLKYNNLTQNSNYITGIVLTNINNNTGYRNIKFPNGTYRYAYVYYDSSFLNLKDDPNNILKAWYSNYNVSTNNKSSIHFNIFISAGVPSAPGIPQIIGSQTNSGINAVSFNLFSSPPTYADSGNTGSSAIIKQYNLNYSTLGSNKRYPGPIGQTGSMNVQGLNGSFGLTQLYPDASYIFVVSCQNNSSNSNYGPGATGYVNTTNILPRAFTSGIDLLSNMSFKTAKLVTDDTTQSRVLFSTPTLPFSCNSFTSPIHQTVNRGSTNSNLLNINVTATNNGVNSLYGVTSNLLGFPAANKTVTNDGMSLTSVISDTYGNSNIAYQGFYLESSNTIKLSSPMFVSTRYPNIITVQQTQSPNTSTISEISSNFYYDNYSGNPIISAFDISLNQINVNVKQISGIYIFYNGITLNTKTTVKNIGNYFYNSTKILEYSNPSLTKETSIYTNTGYSLNTPITQIPSNGITFTNTNVIINSSTFTKSYGLSVTAYGPDLTRVATLSSNTLYFIIDTKSYDLINNESTTIPLANGTSNQYRVWTGVSNSTSTPLQYVTEMPPNRVYANVEYHHSWDITNTIINDASYTGFTINANQELQVFNGSYSAKGTNTNGYLNYNTYLKNYNSYNSNDYSNSKIGTTGYRYATFAWNIQSSPTNYNKVTFTINGIQLIKVNNNLFTPTDSSSRIYLFYRIEDSQNYQSFNSSYNNTVWLDVIGSSFTNQTAITSGNYFDYNNTSYKTNGPYSANLPNPSYISNTLTIYDSCPSIIVSNSNTYIYLRIGLPMNSSVGFTTVKCNITP